MGRGASISTSMHPALSVRQSNGAAAQEQSVRRALLRWARDCRVARPVVRLVLPIMMYPSHRSSGGPTQPARSASRQLVYASNNRRMRRDKDHSFLRCLPSANTADLPVKVGAQLEAACSQKNSHSIAIRVSLSSCLAVCRCLLSPRLPALFRRLRSGGPPASYLLCCTVDQQ